MKQILLLIIAGVVVAGCSTGYTVTLKQSGSNVVATGSGAINLTGLTFSGGKGGVWDRALIYPINAVISTGPAIVPTSGDPWESVDVYGGFTGPTSFGNGRKDFPLWPNTPDTGSGPIVGISSLMNSLDVPSLYVPENYVSGTGLSSTSTYNNVTLESLGVTPGTYVWTWGTGVNQNFILIIGPFKWWWWLRPLYWRFHFPEWRSWPPPWPPPRDLPRPNSGDRELAK